MRFLFASMVSCLALSGCTITTNDSPETGTIVAHWTVLESADPSACGAAMNARIDVVDASGRKVNAADTARCDAFGATLVEGFPVGTYTVQITLLGADGAPVTTTASTPVTVSFARTTDVSFDFPSNSFLGAPPTTGSGALEVHWTIDETSDGTRCDAHGAANAHVEVLDASSVEVNATGDMQTCSALGTSFTQTFTAGVYTVRVTLLAADGTPRTTSATSSVTVPSDGSTAQVTFDFPASSFL
jgi:methionine-rich copper-binding protein CopC